MYSQKNWDITPGLPSKLSLDVLDDTYLKLDLTNYTFKFEILDPVYSNVVLAKTAGDVALGKVTVTLDEADTADLGTGLFNYRFVIKDSSGFSSLAMKGFINSEAPEYDETAIPGSGVTTLPDGALYVNRPTTLSFDTWYATTTSYRLIVSGIGFMTLDLRDNTGGVFTRVATFETIVADPVQWIPFFGQFTSFRIMQPLGNNTVKFLP